jgi:ectoine hydroxylase-related dioxygenase (phytanoyl-CoA dioxygenase family)
VRHETREFCTKLDREIGEGIRYAVFHACLSQSPVTGNFAMSTVPLLDDPYPLSEEQIAQFRADGFIQLSEVFDETVMGRYRGQIARVTYENDPNKDKTLNEKSTYEKAFIQVTNLWTKDEIVREFACSKRLAHIAARLLGTTGVRMWHDQALFKEPSGGFTPWHVDQQYWPMATPLSVTAWIPLQDVPLEMGPLCFGRGSHQKKIARDLDISDESEQMIQDEVKKQKIEEVQKPFALGDVSFHYGWTLHRAGPNTTDQAREVFTVIYMDWEMTLAEPKNDYQKTDWEVFTPSTKIGEVMDDPLNPVLWP